MCFIIFPVMCDYSFRVPPADDSQSHHTFEVYDKRGYDLHTEVRSFCIKHSLNMSTNGPCCEVLHHAKHQQHMIRFEHMYATGTPNPNPHFGICISTYQRPYDLDFLLLHNTSLASVMAQSYSHWTIILVGDALTEEQESIMLGQVKRLRIPPEKIIYRNLDPQLSEKNIFKERAILPCAVFGESAWCHSGTGAMNLAFDVADSIPEVTHLIWLSDDDTFFSNHLANLARAFKLRDDVKFAFTRGYSLAWSWIGSPATSISEASFIAPTPCKFFDHAAAWSKSLNLRLRLDVEQSQSKRYMEQCCGLPCVDGLVLPNDADLFERINTLVTRDELFASVFIPQIDLIHLSPDDRLDLVEAIKKDNTGHSEL
jgi:hypothetical protein